MSGTKTKMKSLSIFIFHKDENSQPRQIINTQHTQLFPPIPFLSTAQPPQPLPSSHPQRINPIAQSPSRAPFFPPSLPYPKSSPAQPSLATPYPIPIDEPNTYCRQPPSLDYTHSFRPLAQLT
ncbi:uncharacterized protein LY89DRAFT_691989 [Mollisia scopiformis]|uniref:Uncharacterized protein n=1 Tax=Mollisia scopiformis TaxID=149040 RepID=A0A132B6B4_MOLSC|nr:uncharacterized protein LY89DRAFT_691989 [Mollisia scopiformis]KUJ07217.1 hypothetical protein LY89DRAFT_691989 [Mollisia scopiformis]